MCDIKRYKVETHLHTKEGSLCATATGVEQVRARKEEGYDTIFVTDHFFRGNTRPDRDLPWEQYVEQFGSGYRNAKAEGDKLGINVLFGWEDNFMGAEFLCYGPDEEWLKAHPDMKNWTPPQLYREVKAAGGMVIQAHPFRQRGYLMGISIYPEYCDGIEAFNMCQPRIQNDHAVWYAKEFQLRMTAGSDIHHQENVGGGMWFHRPIKTVDDYIRAVMNFEPYELIEN